MGASSQILTLASAATKRWLRFCYLVDRYIMMSLERLMLSIRGVMICHFNLTYNRLSNNSLEDNYEEV